MNNPIKDTLNRRIFGIRLGDAIKVLLLIFIVVIGLQARTLLVFVTGSNTPLAVVEGYSMFPLLREGDLVFAYKPSPNDIHVGDIVIYRGFHGELIIHRVVKIVEKNGEKYYVTRGDNNEGNDYFQFLGKPGVTYDRIEGKVIEFNGAVFKIPYIGYLSIWYHQLRS